jgi:hypothetical protein
MKNYKIQISICTYGFYLKNVICIFHFSLFIYNFLSLFYRLI